MVVIILRHLKCLVVEIVTRLTEIDRVPHGLR